MNETRLIGPTARPSPLGERKVGDTLGVGPAAPEHLEHGAEEVAVAREHVVERRAFHVVLRPAPFSRTAGPRAAEADVIVGDAGGSVDANRGDLVI